MLLGASSAKENGQFDVHSVTSESADSGVPHSAAIRALTEATVAGDWLNIPTLREQASTHMSEQNIADVFVVAAAFNGITRVADAIGIPLDSTTAEQTEQMRQTTGIERFEYANKTARYQPST